MNSIPYDKEQRSRMSDGFGWKLKISHIPCEYSPNSGSQGQLFPSLYAGSVGLKRWLPNHTLNPGAKLLLSPLNDWAEKESFLGAFSMCENCENDKG